MSWSSLARATRRAINRNLLLSQFKPLHQNHHPFQQPICNKRCEIKKHFSTSYKVGGGSAANSNTSREQKSKKMLIYLTGLVVAMVGSSYAAVPLYRRFCQATGYGGTVQRRESVEEKIARHSKDGTVATRCLSFSLLALYCLYREIAVQFNADVGDGMPWKFAPTQREVRVKPGESALAFYTAENRSSTPITGVSTYNVTPMKTLEIIESLLKEIEILLFFLVCKSVTLERVIRFCGRNDVLRQAHYPWRAIWKFKSSNPPLFRIECEASWKWAYKARGVGSFHAMELNAWKLEILAVKIGIHLVFFHSLASVGKNPFLLMGENVVEASAFEATRDCSEYLAHHAFMLPLIIVYDGACSVFIRAAVYFNKIQCFCFEEQRLLPGEQIDMPVFFYIDPEFETDPKMDGINNIILSYTFFKVSEE
ncbi:hypothetical protein DKX38_000548 [Salix brachista]|uniref:Cytochrome c oxidase assembly protein COX11, mitochondrial n=1 Tax=Salix brachista TaxID=2182728 RepID=A0A5N5P0W1_9ROSI|nr:hypothetical protein DKX38_000548 [Salix brachista]